MSTIFKLDLSHHRVGPIARGTLTNNTFDSANLARPEQIQAVVDPLGLEGIVQRHETRAGLRAGSDNNYRAEMYHPVVGGKRWWAKPGEEWFYGFRFMVDPSVKSAANLGFSIMQLKGMAPDSGPRNVFLGLTRDDKFRLKVGDAKVWFSQGSALQQCRGRWVDFVLRYKIRADRTGIVQLWYGPAADMPTLRVTYPGRNVFGGAKQVWLKQGIYGSSTPSPSSIAKVYISQTAIGHTLDDVRPR